MEDTSRCKRLQPRGFRALALAARTVINTGGIVVLLAGTHGQPQYQPTGYAESYALDAQADALTAGGEKAASSSDDYVRVTVILASVLFLVGLSGHFSLHVVRMILVGVAAALLLGAAASILQLPGPP